MPPLSVKHWTRSARRRITGHLTGTKYDVKNGVVTLTGEVNSQAKRAQVEKVASAVLNVQQVVNELQVKNQKATSSE